MSEINVTTGPSSLEIAKSELDALIKAVKSMELTGDTPGPVGPMGPDSVMIQGETYTIVDDSYDPYDLEDGEFFYEPSDVPEDEEVEVTPGSKSSAPWDLEFLQIDEGVLPLWKENGAWEKLWKIDHKNIDPCQAAADNYLLFGLANNSFVELVKRYYPSDEEIAEAGELLELDKDEVARRIEVVEQQRNEDPTLKLEALNLEADHLFRSLVESLDSSFREYVHLACGGELRWASQMRKDKSYSGNRRTAWAQWYFIFQRYGPPALLEMAKLFREFPEGSSYGGPRWADAADILYSREMGTLGPDEFTNKQLFVDRVFTLEHNGGCFLNKLGWTNKRLKRETANQSFTVMKKTVLKAHCSNPVDIRTLYNHASDQVRELFDRYHKLAVEFGLELNGVWDETEQNKVHVNVLNKTKIEEPTTGFIDWSDTPDNVEVDDYWLKEATEAFKQMEKTVITDLFVHHFDQAAFNALVNGGNS